MRHTFCCVHFPRGRKSGRNGHFWTFPPGWGDVSPKQSGDIFLGTVPHFSGQPMLSKDEDIYGEGWSLLESFLPDPEGCGLKELALKGG